MDVPEALDFTALFAWCDLHASRWRSRTQALLNLPFTMRLPMYYDRQGFPIPGDDAARIDPCIMWARYRERADIDLVRVALDELPDGSHLSTVWLGIDHQFGLGPPLIFETMRFAGESHTVVLGGIEHEGRASLEFPDPFGEPGETCDQLRYSTEEEASAAHHEIVRRLRITEGH